MVVGSDLRCVGGWVVDTGALEVDRLELGGRGRRRRRGAGSEGSEGVKYDAKRCYGS